MPALKIKPSVIYSILAIYICLQFSWWAYMLISLNNQVFLLKKEMLMHENTFVTSSNLSAIEQHWKNKKWMIVGEGAVFLLLLIYGFYKTKKAFNTELLLAHQKKNFLLSITHELKSPLSSIKLYLQTLEKRNLEETQKKEIISKSLEDTQRLSNLVENLLLAARLDGNNFPLFKEDTEMSAFIANTLKNEIELNSGKHTFELNLEKNTFLKIDQLAFSSILLNLLENAIKYSPLNSRVSIHLSRKSNYTSIQFVDEGVGIPETEKEEIFNKFYRIGNEETRKTKGTGLGLYLVKRIVMLHDGTIFINANKPKGTIFELKFPPTTNLI